MSQLAITQTAVLTKLVLVDVNVKIWSARKKLQTQDLGIGVKLPDSDLVSLGSKYMIDLDHLNIFSTLKRRAKRILEERGVRLVGAFGVPEDSILEVVAQLEEVQKDFLKAKNDFLGKYDKLVEDWINQPKASPEWRDAIRRAKVSEAYVNKALDFEFVLCRLIADQTSPETCKGLIREVQGLSGQLFNEIADEAVKMAESLAGKDQVTQKTVNRLWGMHEKLVSLAFVSPDVEALAQYLEEKLKALPKKGKLEGAAFRDMVSLVVSLCDEDRIGQLASAMANQTETVVPGEFDGMFEAQAANSAVEDQLETPAQVVVDSEDPVDDFVEMAPVADEVITDSVVGDSVADVDVVSQAIDLAQASVDICEAVTDDSVEIIVPASPAPIEVQDTAVVVPLAPADEELDFCV
jgi:hypothetical protein